MKKAKLTAAMLVGLASQSMAQQDGFRVGDSTVYPTLGLTLAYDDNINGATDDRAISSRLTVISPGLQVHAGTERSALRLQLSAEFGDYQATELDDYEDYGISLGWDYAPTVRTQIGANVAYFQHHTRRGDGLRRFDEGFEEREVDVFNQLDYSLRVSFGGQGARGRIAADIGHSEIEYENNRDLTAIADRETDHLNLEFAFRLAPKTSGLLLARFADVEFDLGERDHDESFYGVGIDWEATAKTSGRIEVGREERDYEFSDVRYTGTHWTARVNWRPRDYSIVSLGAGRDTSDGFGESLFLVRDFYELSWRHQWRPRLSSVVEFSYSEEELDPGDRSDDTRGFGASLHYQFRPWALFGLGYQYLERDSSDVSYIYDRNFYILSLELSP